MDNLLTTTLNEMTEDTDSLCPFCGASEDNIQTFEIEYIETNDADEPLKGFDIGEEPEYSDDDMVDDEGNIYLYTNTEFACEKCNHAWVMDNNGNEYEIIPSEDAKFYMEDEYYTKRGPAEESHSIAHNLKYFTPPGAHVDLDPSRVGMKEEVEELDEVVGRRMRKRAKKRSSPEQRRRNIKQRKLQKKKARMGDKLRKRVAGKKKKVVWSAKEGKFTIKKQDRKGRVLKKKTGS